MSSFFAPITSLDFLILNGFHPYMQSVHPIMIEKLPFPKDIKDQIYEYTLVPTREINKFINLKNWIIKYEKYPNLICLHTHGIGYGKRMGWCENIYLRLYNEPIIKNTIIEKLIPISSLHCTSLTNDISYTRKLDYVASTFFEGTVRCADVSIPQSLILRPIVYNNVGSCNISFHQTIPYFTFKPYFRIGRMIPKYVMKKDELLNHFCNYIKI